MPLLQKLNYDPLKDLTPIGIIAVNGMALAVNVDPAGPFGAQFIAYAKSNPGKAQLPWDRRSRNQQPSGAGGFAARAGLDAMVAVPYSEHARFDPARLWEPCRCSSETFPTSLNPFTPDACGCSPCQRQAHPAIPRRPDCSRDRSGISS